MKCPRCDWRSVPDIDAAGPVRDQASVHADDADHPTCRQCHRILTEQEPVACERCITRARQLLSDIVEMYGELEQVVAELPAVRYGEGSGSKTTALPGGDALVLLTAGSQGLDDDGETSRDGDVTSVAFELDFWERDWRRRRDDKPAREVRISAVVARAAGYLEVKTRWAAETHPGWDAYTADLRRLHQQLEQTTGRARNQVRANASCFDCGGTLVRRVDRATGLEEVEATGELDPVTKDPVMRPVVTCDQCHRRYGPVEYLLALRAVSESGLQGWVGLRDASKVTGRSLDTLKSWSRRLAVSSCCVVTWTDDGPKPGRQLVWWPDVQGRTDKAQRRSSRAAS